VFGEYLLVLRGLGPLQAMKRKPAPDAWAFLADSAVHPVRDIPLWLLEGRRWPCPARAAESVAVADADRQWFHSFLQLFTSVVLFRLFMLISELPARDRTA
jgi:hypothetical protein